MLVCVCNKCGRQIPVVKRAIFPGGPTVSVLELGKLECKQIDARNLCGPDEHYCKSCAREKSLEIDNQLLQFKLDVLSHKI